jgi:hypothetical protein
VPRVVLIAIGMKISELDFPHFCLPRLAGSPEDIV